jgi:hypothetical protein
MDPYRVWKIGHNMLFMVGRRQMGILRQGTRICHHRKEERHGIYRGSYLDNIIINGNYEKCETCGMRHELNKT